MHRALTSPVQPPDPAGRRGSFGPPGPACGEWRGGPVASKDQAGVASWDTGADMSQDSRIGTRLYFAPLGPRGPW